MGLCKGGVSFCSSLSSETLVQKVADLWGVACFAMISTSNSCSKDGVTCMPATCMLLGKHREAWAHSSFIKLCRSPLLPLSPLLARLSGGDEFLWVLQSHFQLQSVCI